MSLLLALPPSVSAFNLVGLRLAQPMRPALHAAMSAKDLGGGIDKETHDLWRPGEAVDPARNLLQLLDLWDEEQDGAADECSISDAGENAGCCMLGPEVRRLHLESVQNQMRCSRPPLCCLSAADLMQKTQTHAVSPCVCAAQPLEALCDRLDMATEAAELAKVFEMVLKEAADFHDSGAEVPTACVTVDKMRATIRDKVAKRIEAGTSYYV